MYSMEVIISLASLIISIFSLIWTGIINTKNNKLQEQANNIQIKANQIDDLNLRINENSSKVEHGMLEIAIRNSITEAKKSVSSAALTLQPYLFKKGTGITLTPEEEHLFKYARQSYESAEEDEINAYEEACTKYQSGKLDKGSFEYIYNSEIKRLVENQDLKNYFFPESTSKYQSIIIVYKKWHTKQPPSQT